MYAAQEYRDVHLPTSIIAGGSWSYPMSSLLHSGHEIINLQKYPYGVGTLFLMVGFGLRTRRSSTTSFILCMSTSRFCISSFDGAASRTHRFRHSSTLLAI